MRKVCLLQVPLERLNERLKLHVDQLRADLVDIINADYPEFMTLAGELGDVDGAVQRMKAPLQRLHEMLAEVQGKYSSELATLEGCLQRQSQVFAGLGVIVSAADACMRTNNVSGYVVCTISKHIT